jgi:hypothetical protein
MKRVIPGHLHNPGVHCASTAISDTMTFHRQELDEAMCFGIGCGLGFFYLASDILYPTRTVATRNRILEQRFFENIERPFEWVLDPDPDHSMAAAREHVDKRVPVLLKADIAHLPHYNTDTHFPGHIITMWGYDDDREAALVTDTGWEDLIEVPYQNLKKARYDGWPFMKNSGDHYPFEPGEPIGDLKPIVNKALRRQAEDLMGLELNMAGAFGVKAMASAVEALPEWGGAKDWQWSARWFYQVIEKRGTGGGAFRLLYSRFLEQVAEIEPGLAKAAPAEEMRDIAKKWTNLAYALKEISEKEAPEGFSETARMLDDIREREERFFKRVMDATTR